MNRDLGCGIPILAYHQVQPLDRTPASRQSLVVDVRSFQRQMRLLHTLGYRTIGLEELVDATEQDRRGRANTIVLTFDDGYAGVYEFAFPVLKRYGFTATCFLIAQDSLPGKAAQDRAFPTLGRRQVEEMLRAGFRVGSHSFSHPRLTEVPDFDMAREVTESKQILEYTFGIPITAFCYPYGLYNDRLKAAVSTAGYRCSCSTRFGRRHRLADRFALSRIPVGSAQRLPHFLYRLLWEHGRN